MTADSAPVHSERLDTTWPVPAPPPQATLRVAASSDRGRVRQNNEDRYLVVRTDRATVSIATNIDAPQVPIAPFQSIWALGVADGMGGHRGGEVAATLALNLSLQHAQQGMPWYVDIGDREAQEIVKRFESILETVTREIGSVAERDPRLAGMGTTLTIAAVRNDRLFVYHVGDSRAYLLRAGHLMRITRDQTVAQDMVDCGLADCLTGMQSARSLLTQAMGRGEVAVEVHLLTLEHGDRLLLVTDGLTDGVEDAAIEAVCATSDPDETCRLLVDRALAAGGRDNITAIVADVEIAPAGLRS
jgi:serine/threonine protein phosphatase PrpC